uniref:Uncharacterized protein n=1 Tax=Strongyloides venezuelensis TaxID=75913 RepID=A0A0K0FI74_STRVS
MNGRPRRSKTVGPGLKMGRPVPGNRLRDENSSLKDRGRLGVGRKSRVNLLRKIAGYFEEMVEVVSDEMPFDLLENLEGRTIQLPQEKLELVNSIQAQIIKESLDSKLRYEMPALKELVTLINGGKEIIALENRISDAMELQVSLNKRAEELAIEEKKNVSEMNYMKRCIEAMDDFIREEIHPTQAAIERQKELLKAADGKIAEIAAMFEGFAEFKF